MQHGFFFDQSRCSGCCACAVACKNWHQLAPGPLKYLRIYQYETGSFPQARINFQWVPCYHCEEPACVKVCPCQAIEKEPQYGAVLIDEEKCNGCRLCYDACPYGSPVFESDEIGCKAHKCTMCIDRLELGEPPICVLSCPNRALDFGPLEKIVAEHGNRRDIADMPRSLTTRPAVVFKPHGDKKHLVAYDVNKALGLLMRRDPLPAIFGSAADMLDIPEGMVGNNELVIKPGSAGSLMHRTRCDEG